MKWKRLTMIVPVDPVVNHRVLDYVLKHHPNLDTRSRKIGRIEATKVLSKFGFSINKWNRILNNSYPLLLDQVYFIAEMLECKVSDLIPNTDLVQEAS